MRRCLGQHSTESVNGLPAGQTCLSAGNFGERRCVLSARPRAGNKANGSININFHDRLVPGQLLLPSRLVHRTVDTGSSGRGRPPLRQGGVTVPVFPRLRMTCLLHFVMGTTHWPIRRRSCRARRERFSPNCSSTLYLPLPRFPGPHWPSIRLPERCSRIQQVQPSSSSFPPFRSIECYRRKRRRAETRRRAGQRLCCAARARRRRIRSLACASLRRRQAFSLSTAKNTSRPTITAQSQAAASIGAVPNSVVIGPQ